MSGERGPKMNFDVIVVGAGPAGSAAALELSSHGRRVLVLERAKHPRRKVCGGCLSSRIDKLLGTRFHQVVERRVSKAVLAYRSERLFCHKSSSPFAYLVRRERFDQFLAKEAVGAGAQIHEDEPVIDVQEGPNSVHVMTSRRRYEAAYLVGADGVSSLLARRLGLIGGRIIGVAREAEIENPLGCGAGREAAPTICIGEVPFGYGWVFPKRNSMSIGVLGERDHYGDIKRAFGRLLVGHGGFPPGGDITPAGYYVASARRSNSPIHSARTSLVGDAAGFADPLLSEGIYYGILSSQMAARVIRKNIDGTGDMTLYPRLLQKKFSMSLMRRGSLQGYYTAFPACAISF